MGNYKYNPSSRFDLQNFSSVQKNQKNPNLKRKVNDKNVLNSIKFNRKFDKVLEEDRAKKINKPDNLVTEINEFFELSEKFTENIKNDQNKKERKKYIKCLKNNYLLMFFQVLILAQVVSSFATSVSAAPINGTRNFDNATSYDKTLNQVSINNRIGFDPKNTSNHQNQINFIPKNVDVDVDDYYYDLISLGTEYKPTIVNQVAAVKSVGKLTSKLITWMLYIYEGAGAVQSIAENDSGIEKISGSDIINKGDPCNVPDGFKIPFHDFFYNCNENNNSVNNNIINNNNSVVVNNQTIKTIKPNFRPIDSEIIEEDFYKKCLIDDRNFSKIIENFEKNNSGFTNLGFTINRVRCMRVNNETGKNLLFLVLEKEGNFCYLNPEDGVCYLYIFKDGFITNALNNEKIFQSELNQGELDNSFFRSYDFSPIQPEQLRGTKFLSAKNSKSKGKKNGLDSGNKNNNENKNKQDNDDYRIEILEHSNSNSENGNFKNDEESRKKDKPDHKNDNNDNNKKISKRPGDESGNDFDQPEIPLRSEDKSKDGKDEKLVSENKLDNKNQNTKKPGFLNNNLGYKVGSLVGDFVKKVPDIISKIGVIPSAIIGVLGSIISFLLSALCCCRKTLFSCKRKICCGKKSDRFEYYKHNHEIPLLTKGGESQNQVSQNQRPSSTVINFYLPGHDPNTNFKK